MNILRHRQNGRPVVLLEIAVDSQILFQPLVCPFRLSIRLGVIGRRNVLLDVQQMAEFLGKMRGKSGVSIGNDLLRDPEVWEDVFCKDRSNPSSPYGLIAWEEQCGFADIVIGDREY
jgi:hypothetical protein